MELQGVLAKGALEWMESRCTAAMRWLFQWSIIYGATELTYGLDWALSRRESRYTVWTCCVVSSLVG